jgi:KipI family sensor histidine kinase inhibitor
VNAEPRRMALSPWTVEPLGEAAVTLRIGSRIDQATNDRVLALWRQLHACRVAGVLDIAPAYATLTVFFDPLRWDAASLATHLATLTAPAVGVAAPARSLEIPVCYEGEHALDLEDVCAHTGLDAAEVVRRHSATGYRVHFLGFTPGFPYLGGMDARLATPRRATPRTAVPAGSVGIGGAQTGIYPQRTPGGWQIIGRTPLALFDTRRADPCLLAPGDTLHFVPVTPAEFARLGQGG